MNRQIKFRGKSFASRGWVYGDLLHIDGGCIIFHGGNDEVETLHCDDDNIAMTFTMDCVSVIFPETIGQFTGLTDKNGKEIYEGDVVRYYDEIEDKLVSNPVVYNADFCSFCIDDKSKDPIGLCAHWEYEVIGNIHNNPIEE